MKTLTLRPVSLTLTVAATLLSPAAVLVANAQSQSESGQSVAEAARKAREQKKKSQKPVKQITEEDLASKEGISAAGEPEPAKPAPTQAPAGDQAAGAEPAQGATAEIETTAQAAKKLGQQQAELKALKEQLATTQKDLDFLRRDLALRNEQFYSQVDFAHDSAGKARLDAAQNEIGNKQQEIEGLKTKIAALQELIDRAARKSPPTPR